MSQESAERNFPVPMEFEKESWPTGPTSFLVNRLRNLKKVILLLYRFPYCTGSPRSMIISLGNGVEIEIHI